ncbi:hypothetical protein LN042_11040 [Kitasatospora sp. RB6PN24]|uniref:hypothetical protein n=1 Tax=Kitasatospora humi TaxID=2893891 RepID=UPI001E420CC4|nr:hypothetical protein [Kitasatospora humi]MCC9307631.1 hypothetical protein [Kitasatospora humi]
MTDPDDFWSGDFTLRREPAEQAGAEPLPFERLAASGVTVGDRDLAQLLVPVYRALTG